MKRSPLLAALAAACCVVGVIGAMANGPRAQGFGRVAPGLPHAPEVEIVPLVIRTRIDASTPDPVQTLINALAADTRTPDGRFAPIVVELCVDLDLTGQRILIGPNRSLIAAPGCERGPRERGPHVFVTEVPPNRQLFVVHGDNVEISGFRLEGPHGGEFIFDGFDNTERGIAILPDDGENRAPVRHIEISNMEIFHWSGMGVLVSDNTAEMQRGRLFNEDAAVRVTGSYIHHNQHGDGYGYGVESNHGAYVVIEKTVFEANRHAIAGGSRNDAGTDYSGYTLRDSLILPGGGKHCSDSGWFALTAQHFNCWWTHQIDMHGTRSQWRKGGAACCGIAGETMLIRRNTILYTGGPDFLSNGRENVAIKIRGDPLDRVLLENNVFRHVEGAAWSQNGDIYQSCAPVIGWPCIDRERITHPIQAVNNIYGANPMAELGRCDFVGDGELDDFMATGVTWWARWPETGQWRYLNTMNETLAQVELLDLDRDGVCDVVERSLRPGASLRRYSKGGVAPWRFLGADVEPGGDLQIK